MARYQLSHSMFERLNPDGRWYQVIDTRAPDGTFIGVRVDITEMKEREKALRRSMRKIELFRHVLDELPVAAYVKSDDLSFEFVNKAWTDLTGVSKEEASGQTDRDFFAGEGEGFAERDRAVLAQRHRQRDRGDADASRRQRPPAHDQQEPSRRQRRHVSISSARAPTSPRSRRARHGCRKASARTRSSAA